MDNNILRELVQTLTERRKTIATMESCTGGLLASTITNVEGASHAFKFGAVTYSNEYKIKMGVPREIIDKYSIYSKETATAMAISISNYTDSDYGIGVTGKLMRVDSSNLTGADNVVYVSIYDRSKNKNITFDITVNKNNRIDNKLMVINEIINKLLAIIK